MSATVAPDKILKELADLWVSLGKQGEGENGAGVLRACSMTLVVLTEQSDDLMELGETIAALMPEHPARAIVVRLSGAGERALAERVYSQCWMPFGQRRQICCEQIELTASDASLEDLPSVVLPLAVADLPLILWCRTARLLGKPGFYRIAAMARKVIVDSGQVGDGVAAVMHMAAVSQGDVLLGDLSWARLTRWREMLSQLFENPEYLSQVTKIEKIRLTYGEGHEVTARLMGTWVKDCLAGIGVKAHMELAAAEPGGPSLRVELDGPGLDMMMVREADRLVATVNGLSNCTNLPQPTEYLLMREELGIVRKDPIFEQTLAAAAAHAYPAEG